MTDEEVRVWIRHQRRGPLPVFGSTLYVADDVYFGLLEYAQSHMESYLDLTIYSDRLTFRRQWVMPAPPGGD